MHIVQAVKESAESSSVCDPMQSRKGGTSPRQSKLIFRFKEYFEFSSQIYDSDGMEIASVPKALSSLLHESIEFDVVGIDEPLA